MVDVFVVGVGVGASIRIPEDIVERIVNVAPPVDESLVEIAFSSSLPALITAISLLIRVRALSIAFLCSATILALLRDASPSSNNSPILYSVPSIVSFVPASL